MYLTLAQKKAVLVERFSSIRDPQERFSLVVQLARQPSTLPPQLKSESYRVEGCLARLWLHSRFENCRCFFESDSDSVIMKGIAALLCDFYSGGTPAEITALDPAFLNELGLGQFLTPNRRNGLARIARTIREYAESRTIPGEKQLSEPV